MEEVAEFKETDQFNISKYMHDLADLTPNVYVNVLAVGATNVGFAFAIVNVALILEIAS